MQTMSESGCSQYNFMEAEARCLLTTAEDVPNNLGPPNAVISMLNCPEIGFHGFRGEVWSVAPHTYKVYLNRSRTWSPPAPDYLKELRPAI